MNFFSVLSTTIASTLGTALGAGTPAYYLEAPDNEPLPYVVWNWQSPMDENMTPSRMWNIVLNARSFAASPTQSGSIDALIDGVIVGHTLNVSGWTNFFSVRTLAFSDVETEPSGSKAWCSGGLYRIRIGQ